MTKYMLTGYYQDNNEQFNLEIDLAPNNGAYGLSIKKVKTPFELFCDNVGYELFYVKSMTDFIYNARDDNHRNGGQKLQVIKFLKMLGKLGLREAKELADTIYP